LVNNIISLLLSSIGDVQRMSFAAASSVGSSANSSCCAILAGWLGCQPKNLRRYEAMYNSLNIRPMVVIAPLDAVAESLQLSASQVASLGDDNRRPRLWEDLQNHKIRDIAANVLRDIENNYPCCRMFIFHAFSNGGCLVYEAMRNILLQQRDEGNSYNYDTRTMKLKLGGVIFDSCPGFFDLSTLDEGFSKAVSFCSPEEQRKFNASNKAIAELERLNPTLHDRRMQLVTERMDIFVRGMYEDPLPIPQLFLHSTADKLIPHEPLKRFIEHRKSTIAHVMEKNFIDSPHVMHYQHYPTDYHNAVESFLNVCDSSLRE